MGVRIAIDDFGMGYSSLNYLRALPVDILKIDRAFVTGLGTEEHDDALVEAIIELARVMGLETIAEAVEQASEAERLRELGANLVQGFYFSRPVPAAAITGALAEGRGGRGSGATGSRERGPATVAAGVTTMAAE
jgi:EAL domain-containing protein (putative c-di-GMP-specific phosphodiesterase class I)